MTIRPFRVAALALGLLLSASALASAQQAAPAQPAPPPAATPAAQDGAPPQSYVSVLTPPDTSSPRASLLAFRSEADIAARLLIRASEEQRNSPGLFTPPDALERVERAEHHISRATRVFDFSQVPPASLRSVSLESALLLKEILDRIPLPPPHLVPDSQTLPQWTLPGTEITFVRSANGNYLISPDTIRRLEHFYELVASRPAHPDASADIYDFYSLSPGMLLPPKWLGQVLERLPDWAQEQYLDQAIWQWIAIVGLAFVCIVFIWLAIRLDRLLPKPRTAVSRNLRRLVLPLLIIVVALLYERAMDTVINVTGPVLRGLDIASQAVSVVAWGWAAVLASNTIAEWILESPAIPSRSLDANLLRAAFRLVGGIAAAVIFANGATSVGIPLVGVIAGLGVGGLAIALAAQPTIENFIGGIILYADRPARVGDECQFGDMRGTVEEIGIRSTRIRGKDRTLITVPNADFAKIRLINFSRRDYLELNAPFALRQDTTPDQLRHVLTKLKEMLVAHPMVVANTVSVRLTALKNQSMHIDVTATIGTRNGSEFSAVREDLLLRGIAIVHASGTDFAYPAQTLYLARDAGVDGERRAAAEAAVEAWRDEKNLPFPDLPQARVDALKGTLDWPPEGSVPTIDAVIDKGLSSGKRRRF